MTAEIYFNKGNHACVIGDFKGSIKYYTKAIELNPDFADAYYNRGTSKTDLSDYLGAIEDYNKAIELNPDFADAYYNRGTSKADLSDYLGAIEDFDKAIELNPDYAHAYYNRGTSKANLSDYLGAIEDFDKAIELNPDDADAYYNRGISKDNLSDYRGAIEDYDKAIELNPDYADAYNNRGGSKDNLSDYRGAIEDYNKAIELNPDFAVAYNNRGVSKDNLSDYRGAIEDYDKAIELNPDYAYVYNNRGGSKYNLTDYRSAIEDYDKAIELNPDYAHAYYNRGNVYDKLNEKANAISDWLLCLYLSIKQNNAKCICMLLSNNSLQAYPQNIKCAFEQVGLHYSFFQHFQRTYDKLADFDLLFEFYENTEELTNRELLSAKAISYYYFGGNVQSFRIYDEQLDFNDIPLSAQELYYYALTAKEIGYYEAQVILEDCIRQLENKTDKSDEEYYYFGHLYLLNNEDKKATEQFNKSSAYKFSVIMQKHFIGKNDLNCLTLSGEIDCNNNFSQFSDYFHFRECCNTINIGYRQIWESFAFTDEGIKFANEKIRRISAEKLKEKLQVEFAQMVETETAKNEDAYKENNYKEKGEQDRTIKEELDYIENAIIMGYSLENQLGLMIESPKYKNPKLYLYFIKYYYKKEMINPAEVFTLYFYLLHILKKKNKLGLNKIIVFFIEAGKDVFKDVGVKLFFTAIKSIIPIMENLLKEYEEFSETKNILSDYRNFKVSFWRFIDNDREILTKEEFNQKYLTFEWIDKECRNNKKAVFTQ